jgi:hypothetical protein
MLQVFYLDVAKVDMVLYMLQWTHLPQSPTPAEAMPSVIVRGPEASRCIRGTHPEAGQVTGTQRCDMQIMLGPRASGLVATGSCGSGLMRWCANREGRLVQ